MVVPENGSSGFDTFFFFFLIVVSKIKIKTFEITVDNPRESCYYNNTNFRNNNFGGKKFRNKSKKLQK